MKALLTAAALGALALAPVAAMAEEKMIEPAPAANAADAAASAATEAAADAEAAKEATLKDGTKVVIEGDMVSVVDAHGAKTPAPDGEHELADGTKIKTMGGKVVHDDAHDAGEAH